MTEKRISPEIALALTACDAQDFFANHAKDEGHIARRWNLLKQALLPARPNQGWRVRKNSGGWWEDESNPDEDLPLFNEEWLQANYDDAKAKSLIERALHEGDTEADAALCKIFFSTFGRTSSCPAI